MNRKCHLKYENEYNEAYITTGLQIVLNVVITNLVIMQYAWLNRLQPYGY